MYVFFFLGNGVVCVYAGTREHVECSRHCSHLDYDLLCFRSWSSKGFRVSLLESTGGAGNETYQDDVSFTLVLD
jgi:hypothetical protein